MKTGTRYENEETRSNFSYPPEYKGPKSIVDQVEILAEIFKLDSKGAIDYAHKLPDLPDGAEGWFATLSEAGLLKLSKTSPVIVRSRLDLHSLGLQRVFSEIANSRKFVNWREEYMLPQWNWVHGHNYGAYSKIARDQSGDIMILPAQFGFRHRGRSFRRAAIYCLKSYEFALSSCTVGCMLLTHPERETRRQQLHPMCAANIARSDVAPFYQVGFSTSSDKLVFCACGNDEGEPNRGLATGFIPEQ